MAAECLQYEDQELSQLANRSEVLQHLVCCGTKNFVAADGQTSKMSCGKDVSKGTSPDDFPDYMKARIFGALRSHEPATGWEPVKHVKIYCKSCIRDIDKIMDDELDEGMAARISALKVKLADAILALEDKTWQIFPITSLPHDIQYENDPDLLERQQTVFAAMLRLRQHIQKYSQEISGEPHPRDAAQIELEAQHERLPAKKGIKQEGTNGGGKMKPKEPKDLKKANNAPWRANNWPVVRSPSLLCCSLCLVEGGGGWW